MIGDFHIHSKYSYDSIMEPRKILESCKRKGYDVISITDHNSITGSLEAKEYEEEFGIEVLVGEEIATDVGDIIAIGLKREIKGGAFSEVLEEIKQQGGISILPHPYKGHRLSEDLLQNVDLIEGFNSRVSNELNEKAVELAHAWNKPIVAGSDAHFPAEIGLARTITSSTGRDVRDALLSGDIETFCIPTRGYWILLSHVIKTIKTGQYESIPVKLVSVIKSRTIKGGRKSRPAKRGR